MPLVVAKLEVVVPFAVPRTAVPMASRFRSTWLSSSIRSLRERNLLERYLGHLPLEHHASVLHSIAGVWLPIDVATAHYKACDLLKLSTDDLLAIGEETATRTQGTLISVVTQLARGAGVTPWTVLEQLNRLWSRIWAGGAIAVYRAGPKEAVLEIIQWPCATTHYCQVGLRGVVRAQLARVCSKAYVFDVPSLFSPTSLGYRVAWA